jgi:hypothetical protein
MDGNGNGRLVCTHPQKQVRVRTHSNGSTHYLEQCTTCGEALRAIAKRDAWKYLTGLTKFPAWDDELAERWCQRARGLDHAG